MIFVQLFWDNSLTFSHTLIVFLLFLYYFGFRVNSYIVLYIGFPITYLIIVIQITHLLFIWGKRDWLIFDEHLYNPNLNMNYLDTLTQIEKGRNEI